mmetsp:Transcript_8951/g.19905  ORF Transcript_8951/g.19905 Transcript_8951/m.19905 type:complete len:203 (+) Transcript_8951:75-683(+)
MQVKKRSTQARKQASKQASTQETGICLGRTRKLPFWSRSKRDAHLKANCWQLTWTTTTTTKQKKKKKKKKNNNKKSVGSQSDRSSQSRRNCALAINSQTTCLGNQTTSNQLEARQRVFPIDAKNKSKQKQIKCGQPMGVRRGKADTASVGSAYVASPDRGLKEGTRWRDGLEASTQHSMEMFNVCCSDCNESDSSWRFKASC